MSFFIKKLNSIQLWKFILTVGLGLILQTSWSQKTNSNLDGNWVGIITQENGPIGDRFEFEMTITIDGNKVRGISHETAGDYFVTMEFSGTIKSQILILFEDVQITHHKTPEGINWCIKKGQLIYKKDGNVATLEGFWQGKTDFGICSPGRIFLKKVSPRA